ncbi:hypothetical protein BJF83_23190 [Nocardiopsis sp. CNR-923]|uniref:hypothetical protein n=1 Tax=Nocardiopsis sp. CNR-923 TaxID=1904965 RepID=UPI0009616693|nr:hypothetical protein [Nocardiopsis sp. CNR-923]OLT25311.1 hypothetical protein BJF83_23190 [Nocardiopsis sp. CNR-923]
MTDLHPDVRTMLALLLMLNRKAHAEVWGAISMRHSQHDLAQFLRPLVERTLEGSRPAARSLATEVLTAFADLDEEVVTAIGNAIVGRGDGHHPNVGRVWVQQLTEAALRVRHELMPETLDELLAHW